MFPKADLLYHHDPFVLTPQRKRDILCKAQAIKAFENKDTEKKSMMSKFSQETTIHGFKYFGGEDHAPVGRFVWLFVSIFCFGLCCFTIYPQYMTYLEGDIRTTTLLEQEDSITFPALTIINVNQFRRSAVGANPENIKLLVGLGYAVDEVVPLCGISSTNQNLTSYDLINNVESDKSVNPYGGIITFMLTGHDAFQSVLSCTMDAQDCSDNISNHMTDSGWAFTFNPGNEWRVSNMTNVPQFFREFSSYPMMAGQPIQTTATGPTSGVYLELNAKTYDYCDAGGAFQKTAGFQMIVHDPNFTPLFSMQDSVALNPGYRTTVVVRSKRYNRETEELGKCTNHVQLELFKNGTKYYQQQCYQECQAVYINSSCGCMPKSIPSQALRDQMFARNVNIMSVLCISVDKAMCEIQARKKFNSQPLHKLCPQCKVSCQESLYKVEQVTSQTYPAENTAFMYYNLKHVDFDRIPSYWPRHENDTVFMGARDIYRSTFLQNGSFSSIKEVRENLLMLHVYLQSLIVEVTIEEPLMAISELTSQVGGATGLFLGASVLSIFEIIYWLYLFFHNVGQRRIKKYLDKSTLNPVQ